MTYIYKEKAASGRGKCHLCKKVIKMGSERIVIEDRTPFFPIKNMYCLKCGKKIAREMKKDMFEGIV